MTTDDSPFVEFTCAGPTTYGGVVLRVNQIKAVEQGPNSIAMVVLFEKMNGYDYFWTQEPYTVVRERVFAARNEHP